MRWDADAPWHPPDGAPDYTVLLVFESPRLDRFLMARHRTRGWELPGGRVERGESLRAAAHREWKEETGLPLAFVEPLVLHERPDGSRGHTFLGAASLDADWAIGAAVVPEAEEQIVEVRPVRRLRDVAPLAFPDDPYEAIAEEVWKRAERRPWVRGTDGSLHGFVSRLSVHPEAHPKGHRVVRHPAALV